MKEKAFLRLALMALLLLTATVIRAGDVQYLTIMVQGKPVSFALSDKPVITYQNNQLVVTTAEETVEIPVADRRVRRKRQPCSLLRADRTAADARRKRQGGQKRRDGVRSV